MTRLFLDFDGTIATNDVVDMILERYADASWKNTEKEWVDGKIGSRECLSRQLALVNATEAELDKLANGVELDPGFAPLVKTALSAGVPAAIVSDGFDFIIKRALAKVSLTNIPVYANSFSFAKGKVEAVFPAEPCEHGCANCKVRVIRSLKKPGEKIVFVGDGLSDRHAAAASDLTFAKSKLLTYCLEKGIPHKPYKTLNDIDLIFHSTRKDLHGTLR
jgi:2,3-diketo-5-methylthio-1-phosphopentane phosphatase